MYAVIPWKFLVTDFCCVGFLLLLRSSLVHARVWAFALEFVGEESFDHAGN